MTDIKADVLQFFMHFLIKKTSNTNKRTGINSGVVSQKKYFAK